MQTVTEALGAEVISEPPAADAPVVTAPAETPAAPAVQADFPACGQPRDPDTEASVPGCGKVLRVYKGATGSLVSDDPEENPDLIEIAGLKTRHWLCNNDFAKYRDAMRKA